MMDVMGDRAQYASKRILQSALFGMKCIASWWILKAKAWNVSNKSLTVECWRAARSVLVHEVTCHYVNLSWNWQLVSTGRFNIGTARKMGAHLFALMQEVLKMHAFAGFKKLWFHSATNDKEVAAALFVGLLTDYVCSVRCVGHTLFLCMKDMLKGRTMSEKHIKLVNDVTSYFNYYGKASQLLERKQLESVITNDCWRCFVDKAYETEQRCDIVFELPPWDISAARKEASRKQDH